MNHQVQHHVHVQAARAEFAEAMDLEKQRFFYDITQRDDGRIKALQMTHLKNTAATRGGFHQRPASFKGMSNGFFHHHIETRFHQLASNFGMSDGRAGDDGRVSVLRQFRHIGEQRTAKLLG